MERVPGTRVLLIDRGDCPEKGICPAVIEIDGLVGHKGIVTRVVADVADAHLFPPQIAIADPAIAAAMRPYVGPGEIGSLAPDSFLDMIRGAGR